jgi:uncharacterized protein (DUF1810 family)
MTRRTSSAKRPDREFDLTRFRTAQDQPGSGFESALREMQAGSKQGHWIWYVFPQLSGLGRSSVSRTYGINGLPEAEAYLRNPVLRSRLIAVTTAVADHLSRGASIETLMGSSTDALKLVSSLTLFGHVAKILHGVDGLPAYGDLARVAARVRNAAAQQGYGPCQYTLGRLAPVGPEGDLQSRMR